VQFLSGRAVYNILLWRVIEYNAISNFKNINFCDSFSASDFTLKSSYLLILPHHFYIGKAFGATLEKSVRKPVHLLTIFFMAICVLSACTRSEDTVVSAEADQGVTEQEILLGSSLAIKGHASYLGTQTLRGFISYIEHINEKGGIHGRNIRVIVYDDSYDPPVCLANTQRLIVEDRVFALFSYVGTPTTLKILPLIDEARIPLLGMFTGANALREPLSRYIINVRASYYQETKAAVRHLIKDLDIGKIAVFYQYDSYGFDGLTGTELALKEFGLTPVARGSYARGTLDVEEGLSKIMASEAEAVVMIGTYEPCAKFIKLSNQSGFNPVFYTVSFVGAEELARRLDSNTDRVVIMSQVVPPPEGPDSSTLLGSTIEYVELLKKYFPEDKPNFVGLEGYINARVLVEGLRRSGRDVTREGFIDAIESIEHYPLADRMVLSFSSSDHQGLDSVFFTRLEDGLFVLIKDWSHIKDVVRGSGFANHPDK
jgi:branched-chain amino acid transport system substrate-binding protein